MDRVDDPQPSSRDPVCATCVFTPLYGRLCNVLGRRGANQTAVVFSALGTLACGLSGSMEMLIVARFVSPLPDAASSSVI